MLRFFVRHTPVVYAVGFSTMALCVGAFLSWTRSDASLNRAGALIIIAGVLLGASRFYEWVQQKVQTWISSRFDAVASDAIRTIESEAGRPLSTAKKDEVMRVIRKDLDTEVSGVIDGGRKRLKLWELWLIVAGTFLNGFGDVLVGILKR